MTHLETPLKNIPKITPKYARTLEKMGLFTVQDFLQYFPFRYDDFSKTVELGQAYLGETVTVEGKIVKTKINRIFKRRMTVVEIILQPARNAAPARQPDGSHGGGHSAAGGDKNNTFLKAVWFNQPYILDSLKEETMVRLSGKLELQGKPPRPDKNKARLFSPAESRYFSSGHGGEFFSMNSPAWEKASRDATNTGRLVPVYSETAGISSKWIRWQMKTLLPLAKNIPDILPEELRKKFHLPEISAALAQIHFPDSPNKLLLAQKRMAFQEMLLVQLKSLQVKKQWESNNSIDIKFDEKLIKSFVEKLPFKLTDAQRKASFEILKDLEKSKPMNRLLEGDVGSGKTIVAAIASLQAISAGYQVAIMAPTEVLARQHFESFCELLKDHDFNIALLTNSYKLIVTSNQKPVASKNSKITSYELPITNYLETNRTELLKKIRSGEINLIIGTHALIQKDIAFKNLALVIIDEQHRFGVAQRAALQSETMSISDGKTKTIPHLLTMTATPIPRTLAIAFFGSLDLSILDEMPKNRKPIITKIVPPSARNQNYNFIRREIKSGRQVFIIFPLIEESKALSEVKAATEEYMKLEKVFPDFKIGLLHGRMKSKEKEKVMQEFSALGRSALGGKDKKIDILVSTSVIEVGIDIPNATVMIIENAERFGLSQLHQFRGRVGRGKHQSYCFLFTESGTQKSIERLRALEKTNDGFEISKIDLELRGPGQFFGTLQSGLPDITMENLSNVKLIKFAREEAGNLLKTDPELKKHPLLADALLKFSEKIHLE